MPNYCTQGLLYWHGLHNACLLTLLNCQCCVSWTRSLCSLCGKLPPPLEWSGIANYTDWVIGLKSGLNVDIQNQIKVEWLIAHLNANASVLHEKYALMIMSECVGNLTLCITRRQFIILSSRYATMICDTSSGVWVPYQIVCLHTVVTLN